MTYQLSGGFVRPSLYSNANLLENNLLLLLIVWITDATEEAELYTLKQFYFWLVWTPPRVFTQCGLFFYVYAIYN